MSDTGKEAAAVKALCSASAEIRPLKKKKKKKKKNHDPVVDLPANRKSQVFK